MTAEIRELAALHAANLTADIVNAKDRIEHIRLTRLAEEATALLAAIDSLNRSE